MKSLFFTCALLFSLIVLAQKSSKSNSDLNRFRIGIIIGTPNSLGGNAEYLSPLFKDRVAVFFNYSGLSFFVDDFDNDVNYMEIGSNIYLKTTGSGLYGSLGYGKLDIHSIYENAFTLEGEKFESKAEGDLDVNTFNVKIGFKAGNKFYFRTELGYGFGSIPQEILVTGTINDTPVQGIKEVPDVPGISENGYPLFNIGVGFSF